MTDVTQAFENLAEQHARYERRRQVLFYVMFGVMFATLGIVIFLTVQVRDLVKQRDNADAASEARIRTAIERVASERRGDTDAQTVATENFIQDALAGLDPPPTPAPVFGPPSTPRPSPSPQASPQPRPRPSSRPSPAPKPTPTCTVKPPLTTICI